MSEHGDERLSDAVFADDERLCVGVVLEHDQNRALLTEWLDGTYDVLAPGADGVTLAALAERADLLLLDERAYERHAEWVADYREREASLFSPVLLLASSDELRAAADVWSDVDDVVSVPVEKAVLHARIDGLLSRRALSRELAASEDRFRTLFETSPDPAIVVDADRVVVDSNAAFRDLVGATGSCHGRPLDGFDAFTAEAIETMCATTGGDEDAWSSSAVVPVQTATERRYVECNANDLGTVPGHRILILRDVTERVHHEQELKRQVDRLDEFAGVLAHEIRNPLGIASGWLDQAERTGDPEVTVEVGVTEDGYGVYVADDGVGLGGTDRDQLFESGYTTAAHGTGFGLAIVKQIADAHGWAVTATDAESGGARFELGGVLDGDGPTVERA
jgi:PAS domain-containing protein